MVLLNLLHGQNAFLTAFLLGAGLWLLDRRPVLAGVLFGCLIYKPHLGLIVPFVLIAGSHWRAFFAAVFCALVIVLLTGAAFNFAIWQAYIDGLLFFARFDRDGRAGLREDAKCLCGDTYVGGLAGTGVRHTNDRQRYGDCGVRLRVLARRSPDARNAAICAAAALATPYVLDYDLVLIEIGAAF